jgi:hypothetical protein
VDTLVSFRSSTCTGICCHPAPVAANPTMRAGAVPTSSVTRAPVRTTGSAGRSSVDPGVWADAGTVPAVPSVDVATEATTSASAMKRLFRALMLPPRSQSGGNIRGFESIKPHQAASANGPGSAR